MTPRALACGGPTATCTPCTTRRPRASVLLVALSRLVHYPARPTHSPVPPSLAPVTYSSGRAAEDSARRTFAGDHSSLTLTDTTTLAITATTATLAAATAAAMLCYVSYLPSRSCDIDAPLRLTFQPEP
ncbi:hypothetical protein E2C01_069833 [Portunus trituberculatus]|uniref:Uncharacterized protein n=1 Tax=Portunus trituberculatus TaxID=210409 RepID=A0A5B7I0G5_PORTR|nr:hypothetical protein [Portunus trituberculatus]